MAIARKQIVHPEYCRYYHIIGRCVRRAFLCGLDRDTGRNYEHRRAWVIERLELLTRAFSIDVAGYSVMSNHYHLVVHLNPGANERWSEDEVFERWSRLYSPPQWVRDVRSGKAASDQAAAYASWIATRRNYLGDLSWYMKCLNEFIAKRANQEDRCTGSFWEGRFRSQALMNEKALLACLAYVDLNPIRAAQARTPEGSEYTSVRQRIRAALNRPPESKLPLLPFSDETDDPEAAQIPCSCGAYLELVEVTGRVHARGKRGIIPPSTAPLLERIGFDQQSWLKAVRSFEEKPIPALGSGAQVATLAKALRNTDRAWYAGYRGLAQLFS